ncbi:MAG TPA: hypothetical protein VFZ49_01880 [Pyrinomonadaceae bacterium]
MPFRDTAVFAMVMILVGILLMAVVIAVGMIVSFFLRGKGRRADKGGTQ